MISFIFEILGGTGKWQEIYVKLQKQSCKRISNAVMAYLRKENVIQKTRYRMRRRKKDGDMKNGRIKQTEDSFHVNSVTNYRR